MPDRHGLTSNDVTSYRQSRNLVPAICGKGVNFWRVLHVVSKKTCAEVLDRKRALRNVRALENDLNRCRVDHGVAGTSFVCKRDQKLSGCRVLCDCARSSCASGGVFDRCLAVLFERDPRRHFVKLHAQCVRSLRREVERNTSLWREGCLVNVIESGHCLQSAFSLRKRELADNQGVFTGNGSCDRAIATNRGFRGTERAAESHVSICAQRSINEREIGRDDRSTSTQATVNDCTFADLEGPAHAHRSTRAQDTRLHSETERRQINTNIEIPTHACVAMHGECVSEVSRTLNTQSRPQSHFACDIGVAGHIGMASNIETAHAHASCGNQLFRTKVGELLRRRRLVKVFIDCKERIRAVVSRRLAEDTRLVRIWLKRGRRSLYDLNSRYGGRPRPNLNDGIDDLYGCRVYRSCCSSNDQITSNGN